MSRTALALYIFLQEHVFTIVYRIGKLANPVAQNHQTGVSRQFDVQFDMAMAEDEVVDVGMVLYILLGIEHQMLLVLAKIEDILPLLMLDIAMLGPCQSKADAPTGMQRREEPLAYLVMEDGADELKRLVGVTHAVAMC